MHRISLWLRLFAVLLVGIAGLFVPRTFLTIDDVSVSSDGYANQVFHVLTVLANGSDWFDESPLFFIHLVRTAIAISFQYINRVGGPVLEMLVLALLVWPVLELFAGATRRGIGLVLFFLMFALSFRSVLVCLSIGYLFLYQIKAPNKIYLLLSFLLGALSSGAVLLCVILVLRERWQLFRRGLAYVLYLVLAMVSLGISALDKIAGFNSGESGYEATVGNSTGLVAAVSRNTIIVSLLEGDYVRAGVYIFMLVALLVFLLRSFMDQKAAWYRLVLLAGIPVMALEGLGAVALIVPLLMLAAGVFIEQRSNRIHA